MFMDALLSWRHSGHSITARQVVNAKNPKQTGHIARYLTVSRVRIDAVGTTLGGRIALATPRSPKSEATTKIFGSIAWILALCTQIPDPKQHLVHYCGGSSNRARKRFRADDHPPPPQETGSAALLIALWLLDERRDKGEPAG